MACVLFYTTQTYLYIDCRAVHHACYLDDWATTQFSHELSIAEKVGLANFGTPIFLLIAWRRLEIVRDILAMGVNVLAVDMDVAYFRCLYLDVWIIHTLMPLHF